MFVCVCMCPIIVTQGIRMGSTHVAIELHVLHGRITITCITAIIHELSPLRYQHICVLILLWARGSVAHM